jgi:TPP-dependent pyruvate/acetoin dehydrogenase alpha subunit
MGAHSTLTREERSQEEVERFANSDPLQIYQRRLRQAGTLDDESWQRIQSDVAAEMTGAEAFVEAAPWPDPELAVLDV